MGCGCRKAARAGGKTASGKTIIGFQATFPAVLGRPPEVFMSWREARAALNAAGGGGTITTKVG